MRPDARAGRDFSVFFVLLLRFVRLRKNSRWPERGAGRRHNSLGVSDSYDPLGDPEIAPLMLGNDVRDMTPETNDLLTNLEGHWS